MDQESRAQHLLPQETVTAIFSNVKSIYKFHAEFLLPQVTKGEDAEKNICHHVKNLSVNCEKVKNRGEQIQGINTLLYFSGYGDNIKPMIYPSAHHSVSLSANTVFSAEPALTLTRGNLTKYLPSCKKYLLHTHRLHFMFSPRHHPAADCNFTTFTRNISSS